MCLELRLYIFEASLVPVSVEGNDRIRYPGVQSTTDSPRICASAFDVFCIYCLKNTCSPMIHIDDIETMDSFELCARLNAKSKDSFLLFLEQAVEKYGTEILKTKVMNEIELIFLTVAITQRVSPMW